MAGDLDGDELRAMLDFIWARAVEDERRAVAPVSRDPDLETIAAASKMMVERTRSKPDPSRDWVELLQKAAEFHDDHPEYRQVWRVP